MSFAIVQKFLGVNYLSKICTKINGNKPHDMSLTVE
jgi:hypothetical protein